MSTMIRRFLGYVAQSLQTLFSPRYLVVKDLPSYVAGLGDTNRVHVRH